MTADEIKAALHARALDVCGYLLPAGRRNGDEFEAGSLAGEAGRSLKINLNGKVGLWKDFAADEGGDNLLELWRQVRCVDISNAMREAAEWLGSPAWKPDRQDSRIEITPIPSDAPRGHPKWKSKPVGVWCYTDASGAPWIIVYRYDTRNGKAFFQYDLKAKRWIEKGGHQLPDPRPLYRLGAFASKPASVIPLVEGEKCVDALASVGIEATTALGGAGQAHKGDFSSLQGWTVVIWPDADAAGTRYTDVAVAKLHTANAAAVLRVRSPDGVPEGWDAADAVREGWDRHRIQALLNGAEALPAAAEPEVLKSRFTFVDLDHVLNLPPVSYLVDGILTVGGTSVLAGFSGTGKTFVALDLAFTIGANHLWHGDIRVAEGAVAYVAGEGWHGFGQRARAWLAYHAIADVRPPVYFLPASPQMTGSDDVRELITAIERLPAMPAFIVIDTMMRCFGGGDENSGQDIGRFVTGVDRLREATGAHVMILHHTGWNAERERGHTALRGAVDTLILVSKEDNAVTLSCLKQKDAEPFTDLQFELRRLGDDGSAVLAGVAPGTRAERPAVLPKIRQKALDALKSVDDGGGLSVTKWLETSGIPKATFSRCVGDLASWSLIQKRGGKYVTL